MFDENDTFPADGISFRNSTYFDEIYHARTAYEFLHGLPTYETTHPPLGKVILRVAPYTLGVYLLHEHVELRMLWPHWLGATLECSPWALAARAFCSVLLVFTACILVDMARGVLFKAARKLGHKWFRSRSDAEL